MTVETVDKIRRPRGGSAGGYRKRAMLAGELFYTSDRPCKNGHMAPRRTHSGTCTACEYPPEVRQKYRDNAARVKRNNPRLAALHSARRRAALKGVEFSLTIDDIPQVPVRCPILGIKLTPLQTGMWTRFSSPSLDRVNPRYGYIPGNVQFISFRANNIKGNSTIREIEKLLSWMKANCPEEK